MNTGLEKATLAKDDSKKQGNQQAPLKGSKIEGRVLLLLPRREKKKGGGERKKSHIKDHCPSPQTQSHLCPDPDPSRSSPPLTLVPPD